MALGFNLVMRAITGLLAISLAIMGILLVILSFTSNFSLNSIVLGIYFVIFALITILVELRFTILLQHLEIMQGNKGKGVVYIFFGTLTFASMKWTGGLALAFSICITILGVLYCTDGIIWIFYGFFKSKAEESGYVVSDDQATNPEVVNQLEAKVASWDPNQYAKPPQTPQYSPNTGMYGTGGSTPWGSS